MKSTHVFFLYEEEDNDVSSLEQTTLVQILTFSKCLLKLTPFQTCYHEILDASKNWTLQGICQRKLEVIRVLEDWELMPRKSTKKYDKIRNQYKENKIRITLLIEYLKTRILSEIRITPQARLIMSSLNDSCWSNISKQEHLFEIRITP